MTATSDLFTITQLLPFLPEEWQAVLPSDQFVPNDASLFPLFKLHEDYHGRPILTLLSLKVDDEDDSLPFHNIVLWTDHWLDGGADGDCDSFATRKEAIDATIRQALANGFSYCQP